MGNALISSGKLVRRDYRDAVDLSKHVVYYCNCSCIDHHARILITRELDKKGYVTLDDITWEFNITHLTGPSFCYRIPSSLSEWASLIVRKFFSRIEAAKNIILGKPVHFFSDICMSPSEMKELIVEINSAIKEIDDEQDKIAKELLAEREAKSTHV